MNDADDDRGFADGFRAGYARTPAPGSEARARVDAAWRVAPQHPTRYSRFRRFRLGGWLEPRTLTVHPIAAVTAAMALILVGVFAGMGVERRAAKSSADAGDAPAAFGPVTATHAVQFVLLTPASRVVLVGDFNGWDTRATPMHRDGDAWTVTVSLEAGWHAYSFVVDGRWVADPRAPLAPADDYGIRRSVVVVGDGV